MKKKSVLSLLLCAAIVGIAVFTGVINVSADSPVPPMPWKITLEDGSKIFHMTPRGQESAEQLKSGLYYAGDPPENIYYVDEHLHEFDSYLHENSIISSDGIYFVHTPWARSTTGGMLVDERGNIAENPNADLIGRAVAFYKNGSLMKSYSVGDLLKDMRKAQFSVSHVMWEDIGKRNFNAETNVLTVTTYDDLIYLFDITTGDIIGGVEETATETPVTSPADEAEPMPTTGVSYAILTGVICGLVVLAVLAIAALMIMRARRKKKSKII